MPIRKSDLFDLDIKDAYELASDGYSSYLTTTVVSTTAGTKIIVIDLPSDGEGLIIGADHPVESGDRVRLTGTSGGSADGYYTVNNILTDLSFDVLEPINSSTGGTIDFIYTSGASKIGFDPTGIAVTTATNIQDALKDVANNASGITANVHKSLRQLIHFIDEGPAEGFATGAYREILPSASPFPTSFIWWESNAKIKKIVEKTYTYNPNKTVSQVEWKMYDTDGVTVLVTVADTIIYSGIFETSRTRSIV